MYTAAVTTSKKNGDGTTTTTYQSPMARQKAITKAVAAYARKNNLYARTVRDVSVYYRAALKEAGL